MYTTLFKLDTPIRTATIEEFRSAAGGRYPTKGADLREFGFAWGAYDERPEVADGKVLEPAEPQLNGAFVTVGWAERDETAQEVADAQDLMRRNVTAERDRRLTEGVTVSVTGYGDIPMQGRSQDMINTLSLKDTARDLKAAGITAAIIPFRDANNTLNSLTADQVIEMVNAGKTKASQIYQIAWDMKDGTGDFTGGIPDDFTDDKWWP